MADSPQIQTIKSVADWSKWITGLSMFSVSGCVGILISKGVGAANIINIKLAIAFFLLTVLSSWFLQIFAAVLRQYQNDRSTDKTEIIIFSSLTARKGFKISVFLEMIFFILSLCFLLIWIWNLPAKV